MIESDYRRAIMSEDLLGPFLEKIAEKIDDPVVLGWVAVGIAFVWKMPDLIRAIGEVVREDRWNRSEVGRRQALLKEELADKLIRRRSRELRKD
jgi:hypothetical protein